MGRKTRFTRTLTIGELQLDIQAHGLGGVKLDTPYAAEFEVDVEYTYWPFEPASRGEPEVPAELSIKSIRATANVHFEGDGFSATALRGTDLLELFTGAQVTALEDRILAEIEKGRGDDA